MTILTVRHLTRYRYRAPVSFGEHRMMFRPRESYDQRVLESRLIITPEPVELRYVHDVFGNCVGVARFAGAAKELSFESQVRLEHTPTAPGAHSDDALDPGLGVFPFSYPEEDAPDLLRCIERHHPDPEGVLGQWARRFVSANGSTGVIDLLSAMTRSIHREFSYRKRLVGGCQPPLETLARGGGSCRDFAILMVEAARSLGLAARFVSGYIHTGKEAGRTGGGHTHAWVRVYVPSCGWVEFDPTNGIVGNQDLIRVAVVRDPRQAVPLCGSWSGASSAYIGMDVQVDVWADREPALKEVVSAAA
jgi:transglutaminase-like putative cysteine protease